MGTAAVFAVGGCGGGYFTHVIGMTYDGIPINLKTIAIKVMNKARELRCITKFRQHDYDTVKLVLDSVAKDNSDWLFTGHVKNAIWVSYSAILDPKTGNIDLYRELFNERIEAKDCYGKF